MIDRAEEEQVAGFDEAFMRVGDVRGHDDIAYPVGQGGGFK